MKKVIASVCALTLALAMGVTTYAAETNIAIGKTPINAPTGQKEDPNTLVGPMEFAFDGDYTTRSLMDTVTEGEDHQGKYPENTYFGVDLGAEAEINSVKIYWEISRPEFSSEGGSKLQYSEDGETWQDVPGISSTNTGETPEKNPLGQDMDVETFTFDTINARYIRILMVQGKEYGEEEIDWKTDPSIWEFEVYGTMTGNGGQTGDNNQDGGNTQTPDTGVEFPMAVALVAVAAGACIVMTKKAKAR